MTPKAPMTIPFPKLVVQVRYGYFKAAVWLGVAMAIHGGLFYLANRASTARQTLLARSAEEDEARFVVIAPPPLHDLPAKAISTPKEAKAEQLTPPKAEPTSVRPRCVARLPKISPTPSREDKVIGLDSFRDVGAIGSLSADAVGNGHSDSTVAVGNTGVAGRIGSYGRVEGKSAPEGNALAGKDEGDAPVLPRPHSRSNLSRKARPIDRHNLKLKAPYPSALHAAGVTGQARALITVLADGTVGAVRILSATAPEFARAGMKVFRRFLFEPALDKNGLAVPSEVTITYRFTLE